MKRTYIHLLTFILLFGIFSGLTGTAYAVEFTDSGSIGQPYREAVKEMTARGVLAGFPDGAFHPDEMLTREQGGKDCNLHGAERWSKCPNLRKSSI